MIDNRARALSAINDSQLEEISRLSGFGQKELILNDLLLEREAEKLEDSILLNKPSQLTKAFPVDFNIYKKGSNYYTDYDIEKHITSTGVTYYVDPINGNDTNDGLNWETALKVIKTAYDKADVSIIRLKDGIYRRAEISSSGSLTITKSISIIGETKFGARIITCDILAWTKTPDRNNLYQATRSNASRVIDLLNIDDNGQPIALTQVDSLDIADLTPNSFFTSSDIFYVNTFDNRIADNNICVLFSANSTLDIESSINNQDYYFENLSVYGGGNVLRGTNSNIQGSDDKVNLFFKNCKFLYPKLGLDTFRILGCNCIVQNCLAAHSLDSDGFNYHDSANGYSGFVIEINCVGRNNGNLSDGIDNGSTIHDGYEIIRLNGAYFENGSPNIGDINVGSVSWNVGCICADSLLGFDVKAYTGSIVILEGHITPDSTKIIEDSGTLIIKNQRLNTSKINESPIIYSYS